jgi:hypothetical protein
VRWLTIWRQNVDEMYCGPAAERARELDALIAR